MIISYIKPLNLSFGGIRSITVKKSSILVLSCFRHNIRTRIMVCTDYNVINSIENIYIFYNDI